MQTGIINEMKSIHKEKLEPLRIAFETPCLKNELSIGILRTGIQY